MAIVGDLASSSTSRYAYDVFLSFRGEDTRKTFTDHLYTILVQAGFHIFRDDDEIERGKNIELEIQKAIEQSKVAIIIFSKTYASSKWCLDELVKILHHKRISMLEVLPIFYDIDPSEVEKQTGNFAEAFTRHENKFEGETNERKKEWMKTVERWREALRSIANLAGMVLKNHCDGHEALFIKKIVKVIRDKVNRKVLRVTPFLIGIYPQVDNINLFLQDETQDVSVIPICGMGGIGKSTIAKFVYNLNREKFDASSFLANIKERSKEPNGLVKLQKQLLSDIGKEEKISCVDEGILKIAAAICYKRLLLVLDDVDHVDQLNAVFGMQKLFSPGSRIVVTTRNEGLLNLLYVHKVHQVKHLDFEDSLELFSWHAFGQDHPTEDYLKHSIKLVHHCRGLPLALQVLGSSLSGKSVNIWESASKKLETIPDGQILGKLRISYDSLQDDHDKELFLHIACFFVGWDRDWIITILDECDFHTTIGIENLADRCLLEVDNFNKLTMHQLLQEMGREIVRQESPKDPGKRSRLWRHKDSFKILREKTGTEKIEGFIIDMHMIEEDEPVMARVGAKKRSCAEALDNNSIKRQCLSRFFWSPGDISLRNSSMSKFVEVDAFARMYRLSLLQINYVQITGCFENFPKTLRWLCWHGSPLRTITSDFPMEKLVALDMSYSCLKQVWGGTKVLRILKILDLSHSHQLTKTSDFSGVPYLERLILEDCVNLVEFHGSIGKLERLVLLNLKDCKNLKMLPKNIFMLKHLETLDISGCSIIDRLPTELTTMSSLKVLGVDGIAINQTFSSTEVQPWYAVMRSWVSRPTKSSEILSISLPCSLVKLSLAGCNLCNDDFPLDFSNLCLLRSLDLSANKIHSLPESIRGLTGLQEIVVNSCKMLKSLTRVPGVKLKTFSAEGCTSLENVSFQATALTLRSTMEFMYHFRDCKNLVEVEGDWKLGPIKGVDIEQLKRWGFFNLESMGDIKLNYVLHLAYISKVLPLQRLYSEGVYSYFLPGDKIPSGFSITSTSSTIYFILPPLVQRKIRCLVVCCVYTNFGDQDSVALLKISIHRRGADVVRHHLPIIFASPKPNEDMMWISRYLIGDHMEGGDELLVSTGTQGYLKIKEFGILAVYEAEEEVGVQSMYERVVQMVFRFSTQTWHYGLMSACWV